MKNNKGFFLVEILIAGVIFSVISFALLRTLDISLVSSNVVQSIMAEQDLKTAISKSLSDFHCLKNLSNVNPGTKSLSSLILYEEADPAKNQGKTLVEKGKLFQNSLKIVDISLTDVSGTATQKEFKVYFKRQKAKHLSTKKRGACDITDKSGCYVNKCTLEYDSVNSICSLSDCFTASKPKSKKDPLEGLLLSKKCDRHYGWDVDNNKCVYTGRCYQMSKIGSDPSASGPNKACALFLKDNYNFATGTSYNHPVHGSGLVYTHADYQDYPLTNTCGSNLCTNQFPYSNTHKKCVNDSNNECDEIPYNYRCDKHYGWDVDNEKCVYTGRCYQMSKIGSDPSASGPNKACALFLKDNYNFATGTSYNHPVHGSGLVYTHADYQDYPLTNTCGSNLCTNQFPYSNTDKKCVNDPNGECDK